MNQLVVLDALLQSSSVTRAAEQLHTSPSSVSRSLAQLRRQIGDPLLVRAGRHLVPTPRAVELRTSVRRAVEEAETLLTPLSEQSANAMTRSFTLQCHDAFVTAFGPRLITAARNQHPDMVLRFLPETLEGTVALRDGACDIEIGLIEQADPEIRVEPLGSAGFVGVVRADHELLQAPIGPVDLAAAEHVGISRRGALSGPIDQRLADKGIARRVVAVVPTVGAMLAVVRRSHLVGLVPAGLELGDPGLCTFSLPLDLPTPRISLAWHPRHEEDPAHQRLRSLLREVVIPSLDGSE